MSADELPIRFRRILVGILANSISTTTKYRTSARLHRSERFPSFSLSLAPIPTKYYKHALMNHRDTTIAMFFLIAGLILALIVLIILCGVLFIRVRRETPRRVNHSKQIRSKTIE